MMPVTVIIIAQNEEANIEACLKSIIGWAEQVYVVDSFSVDATPVLASALGAKVVQHEFINWAEQRNWSLENLNIKTDWIFFLDADEYVTDELKKEIEISIKECPPAIVAFSIRQAFIFLGKYLKHSHDAPPLIRLVRRGKVRWVCEGAREYCYAQGEVKRLKNRLWHNDLKGLSAWIEKQNLNATLEARAILEGSRKRKSIHKNLSYSERPYRRWIRSCIYSFIPGLIRPFLFFGYRYFIRGGFLDGYEGFIFCFLHAFWFPLLIEAKVIEHKLKGN